MTRRTIEIVAFVASLLLTAFALHAWLASHEEQQRLQSTLTAQKQVVDAADVRESTRNTTLADALAQIAELKRTTQTPEQIVRDLSKYIPLPQPITLTAPAASNAATTPATTLGKTLRQGTPSAPQEGTEVRPPGEVTLPSSLSETLVTQVANPLPDAPPPNSFCDMNAGCSVQLPMADLKPLDNYVQDCRACQTEISVAKQNIADDAVKITALTNERNAAVTAANGGTFWRRLRRDAVWFAVGAAAGCAASYASKPLRPSSRDGALMAPFRPRH
jgi:hypothetical protein